MFSRSKDNGAGAPLSVTQMNAAPAQVKRTGKTAPSIFSSDLLVEGTLHSDGDIQIDGRIDGNIRSGSLTIGERAIINGEIVANDIIVRGRVLGSIRARKVQLSSTAHVEGDILHNALAVESGAFFDGNCRHAEDPLTAEMPKSPGRSKADTNASSPGIVRARPMSAENLIVRGEGSSLSKPLSSTLGFNRSS